MNSFLTAAAVVFSAVAVQAQESALVLGKSSYGALCAVCHGEAGKGDGEVAALFKMPPPNLTKLAEEAGGRFPFVEVYSVIVSGMEERGHGEAEMPIWGDYFISDAQEDRGVMPGDAVAIAAGRVMSVAIYLESIQE